MNIDDLFARFEGAFEANPLRACQRFSASGLTLYVKLRMS